MPQTGRAVSQLSVYQAVVRQKLSAALLTHLKKVENEFREAENRLHLSMCASITASAYIFLITTDLYQRWQRKWVTVTTHSFHGRISFCEILGSHTWKDFVSQNVIGCIYQLKEVGLRTDMKRSFTRYMDGGFYAQTMVKWFERNTANGIILESGVTL